MGFSSKVMLASALGALTFASGALAARDVISASARCQVVALGYSQISNDEAIASATADASAYICDGEPGMEKALSVASATARAFALAVAEASVQCELHGNAKVQVNASSSAIAAAQVWVEAYAAAFAEAGDCGKCSAYAESWGYVQEEVFLNAVAEVDVKLTAYTQAGGPPLILSVYEYKQELESVVVSAYAEALANAAQYKDHEGCMAWVNTGGCIYTPENSDPNSCFKCEATSVSIGAIEEIDAIADASASAASWTCEDAVSMSSLETTASALARATAIACSYAYASCEVDGGYACAYADTDIKKIARAVAEAYATSWAGAYLCPGNETCEVTVSTVVEAIGSILVTAASEAFAGACTDGGSWTVASLAVDIESASLCALAEANAAAISMPPSTCLASGIAYADATESSCPPPAFAPAPV